MLIRRVDSYMGDRGERVEAFILIDSDTGEEITSETLESYNTEEPLVKYAGVATIMSGMPGPDGNLVAAIPNEVRFPIDANSIGDAINSYPNKLNEFVEYLENQQKERSSQNSRSAAKPEIYVPNASETDAINNLKISSDSNG